MQSHPIVKELVLVGGGHSHAIALKLFGMNPLPGVRLTLITDTSHTPYSGMLPGHVAGFYSFDETHIDLRRLARFAQAQLYRGKAVGLDLANHRVICENRPPVAFDYVSFDIGSTPAHISVPGAAESAIAAKPVPQFLRAWNQLLHNAEQQKPLTIGIVGGGAGGVELALNMQQHLHQILPKDKLSVHLFHRGTRLLSHHTASVSQRLQRIFQQRAIALHLQESVSEVLPHKVICESGLAVECDWVFWVTQASAPGWIAASGVATDSKGFILVNDYLQSVSHPQVFAAGDIATMQHFSRPKAGVFAVRQGKPLFKNLRRILLEKPLKSYTPQQWYLSLIGTGDRKAIASWGLFSWQSSLLWRWKDHIDRQFMERLGDLPEMKPGEQRIENKVVHPHSSTAPMPCAGCGSKVGSTVLEKVLQRLPLIESPDILVGLAHPDDAAVIKVKSAQVMVQTIDFFRSLINDPFLFGQIATNHCLSDIWAMGATPHSALAVVTIPYGVEDKVEEALYQLLSGAIKGLQTAQTALIGGHTVEGAELAFGLSCNGVAQPDQLLRKSGMKPGQALILTKAIGTGTLFAADMRYRAKGRWIDGAVQSMLVSNEAAAQVLRAQGATACTDITGFGLLGHLLEMIRASGVAVQLDLATIPILEGAVETVQAGIVSSLQSQNSKASGSISNVSKVNRSPQYPLLFDPQTSGGLLASVPLESADTCLNALHASGCPDSRIIGQVVHPGSVPVTFV